MARHQRNRSDLPLTADINVTSLVDVAFTLLVVFIIVAPALQGGVEIMMPEADVSPITSVQAPLIVTLTREGRIYLEDRPMDFEEFRSAFPGLVEVTARDVVYVRPDARASVQQLLEVLGVINGTGVAVSVQAEEWTSN